MIFWTFWWHRDNLRARRSKIELKIDTFVEVAVGKVRAESRPFKVKNNAQTSLKKLQNSLEKVQKTTFLTLKIVEHNPSKRQNQKMFYGKFQFLGSIINVRSWKKPKEGLFRLKSMPKHFLNNTKTSFEKVKKTTAKMAKSRMSRLQKESIFVHNFNLRALKLPFW